jgi:hypothetical protein
MATQLSKADKIRKLLHLSNAEIAKRLRYDEPYVRAVRQRTSKDGRPTETPANRAWHASNRDRMLQFKRKYYANRYASDPKYRKSELERASRWRAANPDYHREYMRKRRAEARAS